MSVILSNAPDPFYCQLMGYLYLHITSDLGDQRVDYVDLFFRCFGKYFYGIVFDLEIAGKIIKSFAKCCRASCIMYHAITK